MTTEIRVARGEDVAGLDALLRASFPAPDEALLVGRLCVDGDMVLTMVAEEAGVIVGVAVFSRMAVDIAGRAIAAVALAPVAVAATHRRHGIAEALIVAGHRQLAEAQVMLSFVLGDPAYYERFGYSADWACGFDSPYAGEYLMALPLQDGAMPCGVRGKAVHAAAFAALGEAA